MAVQVCVRVARRPDQLRSLIGDSVSVSAVLSPEEASVSACWAYESPH